MTRPDAHLVNLTPHPVSIVTAAGAELVLAVGGQPARLNLPVVDVGHLEVPGGVVRITAVPAQGSVVDLPDPVPGRWLVVSRVVADACRHRNDLLFPDDLVRDEHGNVVGCAALSSFAPDPLGGR